MSIHAHIFDRLNGVAAVSSLVADRIYRAPAPQSTAEPYITYQQITGPRVQSLDGPAGLVRSMFQIDVWAGSHSAAEAVAQQVRLALDGYSGTEDSTRVQWSSLADQRDDYEERPDIPVISMDFSLVYEETTT